MIDGQIERAAPHSIANILHAALLRSRYLTDKDQGNVQVIRTMAASFSGP
jgi:hypothetical protein